MHECVLRLLRSSSDGESLECFAKLMSTIGKEMDHDKGKVHMQGTWNSKQLCQTHTFPLQNLMEKYFSRVSHIIEARKVDSRVRFKLQDLVDLRQVRELQQPIDTLPVLEALWTATQSVIPCNLILCTLHTL